MESREHAKIQRRLDLISKQLEKIEKLVTKLVRGGSQPSGLTQGLRKTRPRSTRQDK